MGIDLENAQRPLYKLRKWLKHFPKDPAPSDVHALRTQARRLEANTGAFVLGAQTTRHLLKLVAPVRKAAGSVRDMDVLTAHALTLQADGEEDCVVHLLEHLGSMR